MKTLKKHEIIPVYVDAEIPEKDKMIQGTVYISKLYEVSIHLCLCGCGNEVVTPLSDNWWNISDNNGKVSFVPSICNYSFKCKSHYIITNNVANFV